MNKIIFKNLIFSGIILLFSVSASAKESTCNYDFAKVLDKRAIRVNYISSYDENPPFGCVSKKIEKALPFLAAQKLCAEKYAPGVHLCGTEMLVEAHLNTIGMERSAKEWTANSNDYDVEVYTGSYNVEFGDMFSTILPFRCCY